MSLGLEDLGHSVLPRLNKNPVSTLVTGLPGRPCLSPRHESAVNTLVPNLHRIHWRVTVGTLFLSSRVVCPLVGPVAVATLV